MTLEPITKAQLKKMAKIFRLSGRTFQSVAIESGLSWIPAHVTELTKKEAKQCLTHFSGYLITPKNKQ